MGCGNRAGNAAAARRAHGKRAAERRARGERGSRTGDAAAARATRQRAAVARRYAGATARRRAREHGALLLLSRGYGQGEGRGSKCSFLCRVMLRHATGMFHVKHSQNGEQWKGLVRGGRGAWHRVRQDVPGAGTLRLRAVGCACAHGVWLFGREGPCEGGRMGVAHARMRLGCLNGPCAQTYGPLERRGGVLECVGRAGG